MKIYLLRHIKLRTLKAFPNVHKKNHHFIYFVLISPLIKYLYLSLSCMCTILSPLYICICLAQLNFIHPFIQPSTITKKIARSPNGGRNFLYRESEREKIMKILNESDEDYFWGKFSVCSSVCKSYSWRSEELQTHSRIIILIAARFSPRNTHTIDALWMGDVKHK